MNNSVGWLIILTAVVEQVNAPIWVNSQGQEFYVQCGRIDEAPESLEANQILVLDSQGEKPSSKLLGMGYRPKEIDE